VKCKHLLKTVLLRLEEVQTTAEEDKKRVLSYVGYMALDKHCFGNLEKKVPSLDLKNMESRLDKLCSMTAIGTLVCDLLRACRMVG